uniref:Uncharacterized protein n=1 Tax=Arundo donax TaxID=35708 RepID=A0A0A9DSZ7_ARUDO
MSFTCIGSATPSLVFISSMILGLASQFISSSMMIPDSLFSIIEIPVNCGATVPRVSFENLSEAMITGLYCSRTGSTEALISSDAASFTYGQIFISS